MPRYDEVHVRHIPIKPNEIRSEAETQRLVEQPVRAHHRWRRLRHPGQDLLRGPGSALNGGDLNWIDPNALVPEFRAMAKTPSGQLSKPFKSPTAGTSWKSWAVALPTAASSTASSRR